MNLLRGEFPTRNPKETVVPVPENQLKVNPCLDRIWNLIQGIIEIFCIFKSGISEIILEVEISEI